MTIINWMYYYFDTFFIKTNEQYIVFYENILYYIRNP